MKTAVKAALAAMAISLASSAALAADYYDRRIDNNSDEQVSSFSQFSTSYRQPEQLDSRYVSELQQSLRNRGYYRGSIDGLWGPRTTQAIRDYQRASGDKVTGTLSVGALSNLGVYLDEADRASYQDSMETERRNMRDNRH